MNIAVNTRHMLTGRMDGIGWFSHENMRRIVANHPEHTFHYIFDRPWDEAFITAPNIVPHYIYPPARHPLLFYLWNEWAIPRLLKKIEPELYVSLGGMSTLGWEGKCLPVIHDINFKHHPEGLPFLTKKYYNHYLPRYAEGATRIATVSEYSKQDIATEYAVNADKIDVVYSGINESYLPASAAQTVETRQRFSGGKAYFLFVGTLLPRKNIARLLTAYDAFRKESDTDIQLLLVGNRKWWTADMEAAYSQMEYQDSVVFPGYLSTEDLHLVFASALALTFVPYFEGFGSPPVEAMQCGVPVISANRTAMPEIAGDAALIVDPLDVNSIKNGMLELANEPARRTQLIEAGFKRAKDFSWKLTAEKLWASMERCL